MNRKLLHLINLDNGVQVLLRRQNDEDDKPMVKTTFVKDCGGYVIDASVSPVFEDEETRDARWDEMLQKDLSFWEDMCKNVMKNFIDNP